MAALRVCLVSLCILAASAFFPNRHTDDDIGENTFTHEDITEQGIVASVAAYFEENPRSSPRVTPGDLVRMIKPTPEKLFKSYYGPDVLPTRLRTAIDAIVEANNKVDLDYPDVAAWHCSGEAIQEAHVLMINLREEIISILSKVQREFDFNVNLIPDYNLAREKIGQFLHIMQMFYSNTNWVEMKGSEPYYSLGIKDKVLFAQAPVSMDTCRSCGTDVGVSCENNLITFNNVLTSGYHSGQDRVKPAKDPLTSKVGKCSHGGPRDLSSVSQAALGGINKDSTKSSLSPHHYLHLKAVQAAIKHTTFFFEDSALGLRALIGNEKYVELLQIRPGKELIFVIDNDMNDQSNLIKQAMDEIIPPLVGTVNEPSLYTIAVFNEYQTSYSFYQSTDASKFLDYLRSIYGRTRNSCKAYVMFGLLQILPRCNRNTEIYVVTNSGISDDVQKDLVTSMALEKHVRIHFILGNTPSRCQRRKRDVNSGGVLSRSKRDTVDSSKYVNLAMATGGHVYTDYFSNMHNITKEAVKPQTVVLTKAYFYGSSFHYSSIQVDDTISEMTVKLSPITGERLLTLSGPSNTSVNDTDVSEGITIIKNPVAGLWSISSSRLHVQYDIMVEVTAQSTIQPSAQVLKKDANSGFYYAFNGMPTADEQMTVFSRSAGRTLYLSDTRGDIDYHSTTFKRERYPSGMTYYRYQWTVTGSLMFSVVLIGDVTDFDSYYRLIPLPYQPLIKSFNLKILPIPAVEIGRPFTVPVQVSQIGSKYPADYIKLNVLNRGTNGESSPSYFEITGLQDLVLRTNYSAIDNEKVVTVVAVASTNAYSYFQFDVKQIRIASRPSVSTDNSPPQCTVIGTTGTCTGDRTDPCHCAQYKWTASATVYDESSAVQNVTSTIPQGKGTFTFTPNAGPSSSVRISSDCCTPLAFILPVDVNSNTGFCKFDLAPGVKKPTGGCPTGGSQATAVAVVHSLTARSTQGEQDMAQEGLAMPREGQAMAQDWA